MCGIVGVYQYNEVTAPELIEKMLSAIHYRGPDEYGCFLSDGIGLGSARLSIVDIENGKQPICDKARNLALVFNGEIFNHDDLREELIKKGYVYSSKSDTETIFHLYEEEGVDFVKKLNGQFAIAIWDGNKNKLFLFRDRIGVRPLYYYEDSERFIFGSEVKTILATKLVKRELDSEAVDQIFSFWTILDGFSAFKNIKSIPAGHYAEIFDGAVTIKKYWGWKFPSKTQKIEFKNEEDYFKLFKTHFENAVELRLKADVEVGAYLSGGIDSSCVVAAATKFVRKGKLKTYSVGFSSKTYDETEFQEQVSNHFDTVHRSILCKNEDISEHFLDVIWHTEQPIFRTAPVPLFLLSQLVNKDQIKVVLTGEGSDEMLLGYDIFRELKIRKYWKKNKKSKLRPLLFKKLYSYLPQFSNNRYFNFIVDFYRETLYKDSVFYSHLPRWNNSIANKNYFSDNFKQSLDSYSSIETLKKMLPEEYFTASDMDKCQYLEIIILLQGYLLSSQGDRMSMGHSVEGRYPFLDYNFIDFVASLPENIKLKSLKDKYILRQTYLNQLPLNIINRNKMAYQAPDIRGFIQGVELSDVAKKYLTRTNVEELGLFDFSRVDALIDKVKISKLDRTSTRDNMAFTQILSTQILFDLFIKNFDKNIEKYSQKIKMNIIRKEL